MRISELLTGLTEADELQGAPTVDNLPGGFKMAKPLIASPEQEAAHHQQIMQAPDTNPMGQVFAAADPNNPMIAAQRMMGKNQPSGRETTSFQPPSLPRPQP
jgi:hypothetical protein